MIHRLMNFVTGSKKRLKERLTFIIYKRIIILKKKINFNPFQISFPLLIKKLLSSPFLCKTILSLCNILFFRIRIYVKQIKYL